MRINYITTDKDGSEWGWHEKPQALGTHWSQVKASWGAPLGTEKRPVEDWKLSLRAATELDNLKFKLMRQEGYILDLEGQLKIAVDKVTELKRELEVSSYHTDSLVADNVKQLVLIRSRK